MNTSEGRKTSGIQYNELFKELAEIYADHAAKTNIKVSPYYDPELVHFSKAETTTKSGAIERLKFLNQVCSDTLERGFDFKDNRQMVWSALKLLGLRAPSDFLDCIEKNDVIEIYNTEFLQMFCNFEFFKICSYSIEQMSCFPFPELWHREPGDMQKLIEICTAVLSLEKPESTKQNFRHQLKEIHSPFQFEIDYQLRYLAPVWKHGEKEFAGLIAVERCKVLNPPKSIEEEEVLLKKYLENNPLPGNVIKLG